VVPSGSRELNQPNEKLVGWGQRDDVAYDLTLSEDLSLALGRPVAALPSQARNDIERKALLALRWLDKAFLTGDELEALLYRFFALEALLGDKSEGLKAHGLAVGQSSARSTSRTWTCPPARQGLPRRPRRLR
jgi:hypothetical protein